MSRNDGRASDIYGWNRQRLYDAQRGRCYLCLKRFENALPLTADHVYPKAMCTWRGLGNALLACMACNGEKADRAPHPCEVIYLQAINLQLGVTDGGALIVDLRSRPNKRKKKRI